MTEEKIFDVAVVGLGGAGQMAVLRAALNHLHTVAFLGDQKTTRRSRATWVADVDNIPGFFDKKHPITATAGETIKWIESRSDLAPFLNTVKAAVLEVKKGKDLFELRTESGHFKARFAVLATGTMDVQPEIKGAIEPIFPYANRGDILYCIRCDGHRTVGHACAVIGHQGVAGWIAVILKERYDLPKLYLLTHGKEFEGSEEVRALIEKYQIPIISDEIEEVLSDPEGRLKGFRAGAHTIDATKSFVALGSMVHNELAKQLGVKLSDREHVVTNECGETSVEGFYAAGDLVEGRKKQVYTAWDLAVDAIDDIDEKIRILKRAGRHNSVH